MRSKTFLVWLGIPGIFLYFAGIVSGLIPAIGQTGALMSIGALTIAGILFARSNWKIVSIMIGAFFSALLGGVSVWAYAGGFCLAAICMNFLYERMVKHHAAVADTLLIGLGIYVWLFSTVLLQIVGVGLGFFTVPIAGALLLEAALTAIPLILVVLGILIIAANYSKYGSLLRP